MSYYELGQTSEYTGNSPWCYSYDKSLNDPTDQFGPLLNTNVKTASVNPCHCRRPLGPGADCAVGGSNECGPGLHCRKEGASGQLGGIGVCSYTGKAEGMPCFGGARDPCGPNYRCHSDGIGGSGYCVPRHHPGPRPTRRPTPQKTLFPIPTRGPTRRPTPQKTLFPIPTRGPTRRPTPQKTLFPIPTRGPTRRPTPQKTLFPIPTRGPTRRPTPQKTLFPIPTRGPTRRPTPIPPKVSYYLREKMDATSEYGDLIIPLTTSEKGLASNLCALYNNAMGDTPTPSSEMSVIYLYIANGPGRKPIKVGQYLFAQELVKLEYIQYIQQWLNSNAGSNPAFRAKMVNEFLGYKGEIVDWHNELRNVSRIKCGAPGPYPTPRPAQGVYCDNDPDSGYAADRCMQRRGNPIQCAQGPNKIQNCSIGCGKTCQNESWWKCVSNCPGQENAIFCSGDGTNPCP